MMHLEEGDHHEDEAVGGEPTGEHLQKEDVNIIVKLYIEWPHFTSLRSRCNKNCLST